MVRLRTPAITAVLAALGGIVSGTAAQGQAPQQTVTVEQEEISTVDGVKLRGVFYNAVNPKGGAAQAPVVLMLHGYLQNPNEAVWDDTAKLAARNGLHVLRFDFRGHGESKTIVGRDFWDNRQPWFPMNQTYIRGSSKAAQKVTIDARSDFQPKYYPMLVNDIAAARFHLDRKNDAGQVNSSSLYLLAAGDAINLAMLYIASEWCRERKRPNADILPFPTIFPGRPLFPPGTAEPAGPDIRGAIFLGPHPAPAGSGVDTADDTRKWIMQGGYALDARMETQMLFIYGKKDEKAARLSNNLYDRVLKIIDPRDPNNTGKKMSEGGRTLPNPDQSFKYPVDTNLSGAKMLGGNLGIEEPIKKFMAKVEEDRRNRPRVVGRNWDRPLYIDVLRFGVGK
jgi:pimeloyl-ACP methyl ester carboxylesterase